VNLLQRIKLDEAQTKLGDVPWISAAGAWRCWSLSSKVLAMASERR